MNMLQSLHLQSSAISYCYHRKLRYKQRKREMNGLSVSDTHRYKLTQIHKMSTSICWFTVVVLTIILKLTSYFVSKEHWCLDHTSTSHSMGCRTSEVSRTQVHKVRMWASARLTSRGNESSTTAMVSYFGGSDLQTMTLNNLSKEQFHSTSLICGWTCWVW